MKPIAWRVHWAAPNGTSGHADYSQRAAARGFAMMRKASGYVVRIEPKFNR